MRRVLFWSSKSLLFYTLKPHIVVEYTKIAHCFTKPETKRNLASQRTKDKELYINFLPEHISWKKHTHFLKANFRQSTHQFSPSLFRYVCICVAINTGLSHCSWFCISSTRTHQCHQKFIISLYLISKKTKPFSLYIYKYQIYLADFLGLILT